MPVLKQTSLLKISFQLLFIGLTLVVLFSCSKEKTSNNAIEETISPSISLNASNRTSTVAIPFDETVFVSCANGGAGEYVHITGRTNLVYTISWTDHGFTYGYHSTTYKIEGVGLSSGQSFVGSGNTEGQVMGAWVNEQWLSNFVDQIKLVGGNTNFILKRNYHVLVNPDGTIKVSRDNVETACR